jgi:methionyl-tRNA formyltransferase
VRVHICGQKYFGGRVFGAVIGAGHIVTGVSAPSTGDRLAFAAKRADIPLSIHNSIIGEADISAGADVILSAHCHAFIAACARAKARFGALGYHPSLLPRHRGRDAIAWALRMREAITGGSVYWLDDGADTGDIAAREAVFIREGDTARSLWERELAPLGVKLFLQVLGDLDNGVVTRIRQESEAATFEPAITNNRLAGGAK